MSEAASIAALAPVITYSVMPVRMRCFVPSFYVVLLATRLTVMFLYWGIAGHLRPHPVTRLPTPPHSPRPTIRLWYRTSRQAAGHLLTRFFHGQSQTNSK